MGTNITIRLEKRPSPLERLIHDMDNLLEQVTSQMTQFEEIKRDLGINPEAVRAFINHPGFSEKDRQKAHEALEQWQASLEMEVHEALTEAKRRHSHSRGQTVPRPVAMRTKLMI